MLLLKGVGFNVKCIVFQLLLCDARFVSNSFYENIFCLNDNSWFSSHYVFWFFRDILGFWFWNLNLDFSRYLHINKISMLKIIKYFTIH